MTEPWSLLSRLGVSTVVSAFFGRIEPRRCADLWFILHKSSNTLWVFGALVLLLLLRAAKEGSMSGVNCQ